MLRSNQRTILKFDWAMTPYPSDAPAIDLNLVLPELAQRCRDGKSIKSIEKERRVIRLADTKDITLNDGSSAFAMLFCLGDKEKADPGFVDMENGSTRIAKKRQNEGGGLSLHALVKMSPTKERGHVYQMLYEDVNGFGRSVLQSFLRSELRIICDEIGTTYTKQSGNEVKSFPKLELNGHPSDQLRRSPKNRETCEYGGDLVHCG